MNQEVTENLEAAVEKALADIDQPIERKSLPPYEPRKAPAAVPPVSTSTIDQMFENYSRAGPVLRQRIVAERGDLTSRFEREMAAHIEDSRARADQIRHRYEQRLNELDQIARRIGE